MTNKLNIKKSSLAILVFSNNIKNGTSDDVE